MLRKLGKPFPPPPSVNSSSVSPAPASPQPNSAPVDSSSRLIGTLKTISTAPGKCYSYFDKLTKERSHSFAFKLDQMRQVSIDISNQRRPGLFGDLIRTRNIQVILWSEDGSQQLFSIAPGDRNRETVILKSGRYLIELKTRTSQKVDYVLQLMPMKWVVLDYFMG